MGVAVDGSGIYVAGNTTGPLPGQSYAGGAVDAFLRKYTLDGTELWTHEFGTSASDGVSGISIDGTGIYILGTTEGVLPGQTNTGLKDAYVRKYDLDGIELWTRQFGTSASEEAYAISVHGSGVYLAGSTQGSFPGENKSGFLDAFVKKFDTDGTELWTDQFGSSANGISADASGVYVSAS